jgi:hypothetical protein
MAEPGKPGAPPPPPQPPSHRVIRAPRPGEVVKLHLVRRRTAAREEPRSAIARWLLQTAPSTPDAPYEREDKASEHRHPWWQVMCLTGVDYFSTLGYQPGIAALAAGALSPLATLILVLVTLFGALPMYRRVAEESPHGDGSISMLENLLSWWQGKLFVLCLIGFVATGFVITITLSAADAAAHVVENPFTAFLHGHEIALTLALVVLLGAVFLRGFSEAIGLAVALVAVYLGLNAVVVAVGLYQIGQHPEVLADWRIALTTSYGSPAAMIVAAVLVFPRLALGLSGFETGVVVMPLVEGDPGDDPQRPAGRIRNTKRLLTVAALIMSVFLIASSLATTLLIPAAEFQEGGAASGRALAYLAHRHLGDGFGTLYDVSTIMILWFAGASAMAGLLNIVPRYLPRYGMAPEWARASRPLVLIFTVVCIVVTLLFRADVTAQAGAYATGVLALLTSASIAVTISAHRHRQRAATVAFGLISVIFVYTLGDTVVERPEGLRIALVFIAAIVVASLVSRIWRVTELRAEGVALDAKAQELLSVVGPSTPRVIAHDPSRRERGVYERRERWVRQLSRIPGDEPVLFLEVTVRDPSEFAPVITVEGEERHGHRILRAQGASVANTIAAVLMYLRDTTGAIPHAYFSWSEKDPLSEVIDFLLFGEGDIAPVTHEILREAETDPERRPIIHVA